MKLITEGIRKQMETLSGEYWIEFHILPWFVINQKGYRSFSCKLTYYLPATITYIEPPPAGYESFPEYTFRKEAKGYWVYSIQPCVLPNFQASYMVSSEEVKQILEEQTKIENLPGGCGDGLSMYETSWNLWVEQVKKERGE